MAQRNDKHLHLVHQFKDTVANWETDPVNERPSEFVPSTGYSVLSGCSTLDGPLACQQRRQSGLGTLFAALGIFFAIGVGGMFVLMRLLHA